jgi:hypothetical protein
MMQTGFGVHPLIEKFTDATKGEGVVELRGFIGPDEGDAVPLYSSLEMTEYFLMPRDAIVHVLEPERERANDQPTRVYVKRSTELRWISRRVKTFRAEHASSLRIGEDKSIGMVPCPGSSPTTWQWGRIPRGEEPSRPWTTADWGEWLMWCLRLAGPNFDEQAKCIAFYLLATGHGSASPA